MSKKKRKAPKGSVVWHQSAEEATLAKKPRYNGFACGHGAHGSAKYDRTKAKRAWQKTLRQEGASRGSFLYERISATRLLRYNDWHIGIDGVLPYAGRTVLA